ncbi:MULTISPECIES: hypothetical protein [unclassified Tenacibaculum]|uniref:hypothetical protein n=1 Tax=unclassified Tenacibaculum TaxID=2635139 RepID=UPI001F2DE7D2|nr:MULTISPECIES: hypothetical protein [unclassified Tenacibaculum]MCF2875046.1 hypothetical protein [Tenacibaculum sp. Cn5-1]MCF2935122.1 hypothetical protein [Tenacibaculum sp. Cn5-34]MCG7511436.1 hypothetical protein [Tenacibaculum sp. Cn5-46]
MKKVKIAVIAILGFVLGIRGQVETSSNGNVGIGTTQPKAKLDVNGNTYIGNLSVRRYLKIISSQYPEIRFQTPSLDGLVRVGVAHEDIIEKGAKEGDFYVYSMGSMPLLVHKDGNVSLVNKTGKVGIGTTSPQTPLDVKGIIKSTDGIGNTLFLAASNTGSYIRAFGNQNFSFRDAGGTSKINFNVSSGGGLFTGKTIVENSAFRNHLQLKRLENSFNNTWDITLSGGGNTNSLTFTAEDSEGLDYTTRFHISALKSIYGQNNNEWDLGKQNNRFKKLFISDIDATGNIKIGGGLSVEKANPNMVLTDNRSLDNGSWDNVSLGSFQWKTLDATAPGVRVGAEIEAFSGIHAASGPEFSLRFKTSTNLESIATTKYEISSGGDHDFKNGNAKFGGYVGIGTNTPKSLLSIVKGSVGTNTDGLDNSLLYLNNGSERDGSIVIKSHGTPENEVIGALKFHSSPDGTNYSQSAIKAIAGRWTTANALAFFTSTSNVQKEADEVMRIQGDKVGIGTKTPGAKQEIYVESGGPGVNALRLNTGFTGGNHVDINPYISGFSNDGLEISLAGTRRFVINSNGNVGIGTEETGIHKLAVEGSIGAREIKVQATGWYDFVFEKDYNLPTIEEVEKHIKEKGHLKNIPSAKEVLKNGIHLGEMNGKLLEKIEELTLYTIQQEKKIKEQEKELKKLQGLSDRLEKLEKLLEQKN